jgi:hypothetical protein
MSQKTDAELTTEAQVIRDETTALANTKTRVYNILKNIIDSKPNNDIAPGGAVDSVNGQTGVVVLDAANVGADPAGTAAALLTGTISDSDTTHAPTGNAVFDALDLKANLDSPALTGIPTAPTPAQTVNNTQLATTEFVHARVVNSAFVAAGTNDYTITIPGITALADIKSFDVQFTNANTVPVYIGDLSSTHSATYPTLNPNGLGAVRLKKEGNVDLNLGDIKANQIYRCFYDGTNIQITKQLVEKVFNVEDYGAKHDFVTILQASVNSGSATLTSATSVFTSGVNGKTIRVPGAGAAGVDLITTMTFVNATTVTLGVNASTTVSLVPIQWGTDDTAAIQAAITACHSYGGGTVWFPKGVYLIAGALITSLNSVNPNCQLYIPLNTVALDRVVIKLQGEGKTSYNNGPLNNANIDYTPITGTILKSIIVGSGTSPCVLGSAFANNGFIDVNRNEVIINDLAIETKSMTGAAHVANSMTAFNFFNMGVVHTDNILAYTESACWVSVQPASGTYGIRLPQPASNENYGGTHGFMMAVGFDVGISFSEHDAIQKGVTVTCNKGYQIYAGGGNHPAIAVHLHDFASRYGIEFLTGPSVNILQFSRERYPGIFATRWYDGVADFLATGLSLASGTVNYSIISSGGAVPAPEFSGTFGGQINFHDLHGDPYYIYAAGVNPAASTPFMQLKYTGAAVSTDASIPDILMVHNQAGTSHIVATWKAINIASTDADERLGQISFRTNGAVDKGLFRLSLNNGAGTFGAVSDFTTDYISSAVPVRMPSYTVAGVPSASTAGAGAMIYVSNESGGAVIAFSDATNWRRVTDRAVIS